MKKTLIVIAFCMALALCFGGCAPDNSLASGTSASTRGDPGWNTAPLHFYFGGNTYSHSGHYVYTLPEGFELVQEVQNEKSTLSDPTVDFSGNITGYIYMSESDKTVAYFRWKNWDEAANGKEPYLKLEMRNIYFYFEGKLYYHTGRCVYSLPEGFALVGEVDAAGEPMADFSGNVQGEIYMSESEKTVAYFRWKNWDEAVNGKTPYLRLELRE